MQLIQKQVSHEIDFKAVWPCNGHAASMRVKNIKSEMIFVLLLLVYIARESTNLLGPQISGNEWYIPGILYLYIEFLDL